ncbi:MAG TPA: AAA family ATPase [Polyangiaceae bacterium]
MRRVLGKGGTGVVYEAYDSQEHSLVALKTIDAADAEQLYRLKHEFRALADLSHENIVRFGELSNEDGQWFFSMELIDGENFLEHVRPLAKKSPRPPEETEPFNATTTIIQNLLVESGVMQKAAPPGPLQGDARFDEARLRAALTQLVSALCSIHDAGHVHCDVKPSNVLVDKDGRVVLLDFGLVSALAELGPREDQDLVVGTPAFMAPEQIEGAAVGPEADWYAVGIMLHLALTGVYPFHERTTDLFNAKLAGEPPPPRQRVAAIPADLDALCVGLLRRKPSDRWSVETIRRAVGLESAPSTSGIQAAAGVFVGRRFETTTLTQAYEAVVAGEGRVVVVEGDPGVGKSALVQRFLAGLPAPTVVLSGRCYEQESVPFNGIDSVIDSLSGHLLTLRGEELTSLLRGGVRYVAAIFPVLARVPEIDALISSARPLDDEVAVREQAMGELEQLTGALAQRGPLVIYLDDLQWADSESLALLTRLLSRRGKNPFLFVATMRAGAVGTALLELVGMGERLALRGLDDGESRALWDALWPKTSGGGAAERDTAVKEAAGHPLFLAELARAARSGHAGTGPQRLEDVLWRRVEDRADIERRFLHAVALAGAPTRCEILAEAAGVDAGECITRLGALKSAQLIRVTRRGSDRLVEPYHDRVRESVTLHLESQPEMHLRLGRALRRAAGDHALGQRVFAILGHLNKARALLTARKDKLEVAQLHLLACRAARLATAYDLARHHAGEGLALASDSGWSDDYALMRDLSLERLEADYLAGDAARARQTFDALRTRLTSLDERATLYAAWIALESSHQRFAEAIDAGREILSELGAPLPKKVTMANVLAQYAANRVARGRRSIEDLTHLPLLTDPLRERAMKTLVALAPAAYCFDTNLLTWMLLRIAGDSMRHGVCEVSSYGFAGYGMVLAAAFGKYTEAMAFGRLSLALNERFAKTALGGKVHFLYAAYIVPWTRPMADAKEAMTRAYAETLKCGDRAYETYTTLLMTSMTFCEGGRLEDLEATAERGEDVSAQRREADLAGASAALGRYATALRGDKADALDFGNRRSTDAEFRKTLAEERVLSRFFYDYGRAEIAYLTGDAERANALLVEAAKLSSRAIFGTPMMVELAWLEALVAARRFETAGLTERAGLLAAVGMRAKKLEGFAASNPGNFEAHHRIALGEWLRITGRAAAAREAFEGAIGAARAQGAAKREGVAWMLAARLAKARGEEARHAKDGAAAEDAYARWGAVRLKGLWSRPS